MTIDHNWTTRRAESETSNSERLPLLGNFRLPSGGGDETIKLWDVNSGEELRSFVGASSWWRASQANFSPDGKWLTTVSNDGAIRIRDTGKAELTPPGRNWHEQQLEAARERKDLFATAFYTA